MQNRIAALKRIGQGRPVVQIGQPIVDPGDRGPGSVGAAGQDAHRMACRKGVIHNMRADKAATTKYQHTHDNPPAGPTRHVSGGTASGINPALSMTQRPVWQHLAQRCHAARRDRGLIVDQGIRANKVLL